MRGTSWFSALLVAIAAPVAAQVTPSAPAQSPQPIAKVLAGSQKELVGLTVPDAGAFVAGDREIRAGTNVKGPIAVIGALKVSGTIDGDAYSYTGDITIAPGGHITGSAVALAGHVQIQPGGIVDGDTRALTGPLGAVVAVAPPETTSHNVSLTLGWAAVALLVGIGLLVFGGPTLNAVGEVIRQEFGKSFAYGIAATLGIVPVLALLCVGLALTIIGALLIPFAIVAYVLAVVGLVTLGILAAVRVTGEALPGAGAGRGLSERGSALRSLVLGLAFFLLLWLIAALLTPLPTAMAVARLVAFALTWAAATVGLGATIISRAGTRPLRRSTFAPLPTMAPPPEQAAAFVAPLPDWQTPTPVAGVVAARRSQSTTKTG